MCLKERQESLDFILFFGLFLTVVHKPCLFSWVSTPAPHVSFSSSDKKILLFVCACAPSNYRSLLQKSTRKEMIFCTRDL